MTNDDILSVVQANKEGRMIQWQARTLETSPWQDAVNPTWDFYRCNYRVKPQPREWWVIKCSAVDNGEPHIYPAGNKPVTCSNCIERVHVREVIE
jgi:hypothetical protein